MTNAELAVLGLVVERPRYGYEMEQVIEERGMRNWTEVGFSSIYYLLKKLEKKGLVERLPAERGGPGPARHVYGATADGLAGWRAETLRALSEPQRCFPSFLLGLAGTPAFEADELAAALQEYISHLDARAIEMAEGRARSGPVLPPFVEAMFTYSEAILAAERAWVVAQARSLTETKEFA